eukprot:9272130-Pyramimonas_sp.AAC.1
MDPVRQIDGHGGRGLGGRAWQAPVGAARPVDLDPDGRSFDIAFAEAGSELGDIDGAVGAIASAAMTARR